MASWCRPRWWWLHKLSAIRAAAARHHFQTLDFLAHGFVEDGVGQEDKPVRAGVGALVLVAVVGCCVEGIAGWRYALGVHEVPPRGPGPGEWATPAGPFLHLNVFSHRALQKSIAVA